MKERTAAQTVQCAVRDFDSIRDAITAQGERVPPNTPTSKYAPLIARISGRPISGFVYSILSNLGEETVCATAQSILQGSVGETVIGNAEVI